MPTFLSGLTYLREAFPPPDLPPPNVVFPEERGGPPPYQFPSSYKAVNLFPSFFSFFPFILFFFVERFAGFFPPFVSMVFVLRIVCAPKETFPRVRCASFCLFHFVGTFLCQARAVAFPRIVTMYSFLLLVFYLFDTVFIYLLVAVCAGFGPLGRRASDRGPCVYFCGLVTFFAFSIPLFPWEPPSGPLTSPDAGTPLRFGSGFFLVFGFRPQSSCIF